MVRRGSGLGTIVKVIKAIDRANKQSARAAAKRQNAIAREQLSQQREFERIEKQQEREQIARQKVEEKERLQKEKLKLAKQNAAIILKQKQETNAEKQRLINIKQSAEDAFEKRCLERAQERHKVINQVLK